MNQGHDRILTKNGKLHIFHLIQLNFEDPKEDLNNGFVLNILYNLELVAYS